MFRGPPGSTRTDTRFPYTSGCLAGKGALGGVLGDAEGGDGGSNINVQGEAQKKLDVLSNDILLEANAWGGHLAGLASEEMDHSQPIPDAYPDRKSTRLNSSH